MKAIPLTKGQFALVDDADFDWLNQWKWHAVWGNGCWYAARHEPGNHRHLILMHREIVGAQPRQKVDHENRKSLDNQRHNLRLATDAQNNANATKRKHTASFFKGVSWRTRLGKWVAQIQHEGRVRFLGSFSDVVEAAETYDAEARYLFGAFANTNF